MSNEINIELPKIDGQPNYKLVFTYMDSNKLEYEIFIGNVCRCSATISSYGHSEIFYDSLSECSHICLTYY